MPPDSPAFPHAAPLYRANGWDDVLPLAHGTKSPPPDGYTGKSGASVTADDIARWSVEFPDGNLGLRFPDHVVGIDIDAYHGGSEALDRFEGALGTLPLTWTSTSRADGSGIRLYRVPAGLRFRGYLASSADGVDIIQHAHRYAVAWPSIHPTTGNVYVWTSPDGEKVADVLPVAHADLPELPAEWLAHLTRPHHDEADVDAWAESFDHDHEPSNSVALVLSDFTNALATGASTHDSVLGFTAALHAHAKHPGAGTVLDDATDALIAARNGDAVEARREMTNALKKCVSGELITYPVPLPWKGSLPARPTPTAPASIFSNVVPINRFHVESPPDIVSGWLHAGTSGVLVGQSGGGKSFVALDLAFSVGRGVPWVENDTTQGRVLYVAGEGTYDLDQRYLSWLAARGLSDIADPGVDIWPADHVLTDPEISEALCAYVAEHEYTLVILDTLAKLTAGVDENTRVGMDSVHGLVRSLRRVSPSTSVLWIHHVNKAGVFSGHQSLYNGADFFWTLAGPHESVTLTRMKNKYGRDGDELPLRLETFGASLSAVPRHEEVSPNTPENRRLLDVLAIATEYGHRGKTDQLPGFSRADAVRTLQTLRNVSRARAYPRFETLIEHGYVQPLDASKTSTAFIVAPLYDRFLAPWECRQLGLPYLGDEDDEYDEAAFGHAA